MNCVLSSGLDSQGKGGGLLCSVLLGVAAYWEPEADWVGMGALPTAHLCLPSLQTCQWLERWMAWAQQQEISKRITCLALKKGAAFSQVSQLGSSPRIRLQNPKREELFLYMLLHQYVCLPEETRRHSFESNKAKEIFEPTSWNSAQMGWRIMVTNPEPRGWAAGAPQPREVEQAGENWERCCQGVRKHVSQTLTREGKERKDRQKFLYEDNNN